MVKNNKLWIGALAILGLIASTSSLASSIDGKALYETTCAACHGKNLQGGAGFNLKDEAWVHGSQPEQILANIKKGFAKAGMPGFEGVYSNAQLESIVSYVLSKRQGFENLTYKIYHLGQDAPASFDVLKDLKPAKSGKLQSNLMDFAMPEVKDYIIEFEGDLYGPKDQAGQIFGMVYRELFEIEIDGTPIEKSKNQWLQVAWPIKAGKQHVRIRYSTIGTRKNNNKQFKFFVANNDLTQKLFGISAPGKTFLNSATVNIKAESTTQVVRKKIVNLPTSSIAVGFPEKINYAFNTKTCAINGVWTGDLVNVGPNIEGRGRDGGVILGEWLFHSPKSISPSAQQCVFHMYNRQGHPSFNYQIDGNLYSLTVTPNNSQSLTLTYTLVEGKSAPLTLDLPANTKAVLSSKDGRLTNNQFSTQASVGGSYQIVLSMKESK